MNRENLLRLVPQWIIIGGIIAPTAAQAETLTVDYEHLVSTLQSSTIPYLVDTKSKLNLKFQNSLEASTAYIVDKQLIISIETACI